MWIWCIIVTWNEMVSKYQSKIDELIRTLRNLGFLNDVRVESAFRNILRHEFVLLSDINKAY